MKKMTKTNATANPTNEVDYDRLCPEYFHLGVWAEEPWWNKLPFAKVLTGNTSRLKIPTPTELEVLGESNLKALRKHMRRKDRKLAEKKRCVSYGLQCLTDGTLSDLRIIAEKINCDWRGVGNSCMYTCKFGSAIATWCSKTPSPLNCDGRCYHFEEGVNDELYDFLLDDELEMIDLPWTSPIQLSDTTKCPHYDKCHGGKMPFVREKCIFDQADEATLQRCAEDLRQMLQNLKQRADNYEKYFANIKTALESTTLVEKPKFDLSLIHQLADVDFGTTVVLIERRKRVDKNEYAFVMERGVLANVISHGQDARNFVFNMPNGTVVRISGSTLSEDGYSGICMTQDDFNYLLDNPEYRKVWLKMVDTRSVDFTTEELESILARFASLRNATK